MVLNTPVSHIVIIDGQAYIARKRVKVKMIVNMIVHGQATVEMAMEQYDLQAGEVYAALSYYFDNQAAFDTQYAEDQALLQAAAKSTDEHLTEIRSRKI